VADVLAEVVADILADVLAEVLTNILADVCYGICRWADVGLLILSPSRVTLEDMSFKWWSES
jgi:hypothetical protein